MSSQFTVKSARRVSDILGLLAESAEGISPAEVARMLDIPRSSAHALLLDMTESGLIELARDNNGPSYRIGLRAFEIGSAYLRQRDLGDEARTVVNRLAAAVDETAHLTILDRSDIVYVAKAESTQSMRVVSAVGRRLPAHATASGKVLLSQLDEDDFLELYKEPVLKALTPRTITDREALRSQLVEVKRNGWGFDDEESTYGLQCIAVPIFKHGGSCAAALSLSIPTFRMVSLDRGALLAHLREASSAISANLGWTGEINPAGSSHGRPLPATALPSNGSSRSRG